MSVRKMTADKIFTGTEMRDQTVLITNANGKIIDLVKQKDAGDDVEIHTGILAPGFINAHCHLELSHLKGIIPEKSGLVNFLMDVLKKRDNVISGNAIIELAEKEMIDSGIVAIGDISNTIDTISQKKKSDLHYHTFIETAGFIPSTSSRRFGQAEEVWKKFSTYFDRSSLSVVPHAPYSVSEDLFNLIRGSGSQIGSIHNQETHDENEFFIDGSGDLNRLYKELGIDTSFFIPPEVSSLRYFLKYFVDYNNLILVHNVATSADDLEYASSTTIFNRISWCLCPNANLYITDRLPDIPLLKKFINRFVIGTDSLASNHQLSILAELKTLQKHFTFLSLSEMLTWATWNGAQALEITNMYGSFEKGKRPGVILIENVAEGSLKDAVCKRLL